MEPVVVVLNVPIRMVKVKVDQVVLAERPKAHRLRALRTAVKPKIANRTVALPVPLLADIGLLANLIAKNAKTATLQIAFVPRKAIVLRVGGCNFRRLELLYRLKRCSRHHHNLRHNRQ